MFALNVQLQARFNRTKVCYKLYNVYLFAVIIFINVLL